MANFTENFITAMETSNANGSEGQVSVSAFGIILEPVEYIESFYRTIKGVWTSMKNTKHAEDTENCKISHACICCWRILLMSKNKIINLWISTRGIQHDKLFHIGESQPAQNWKATESENLKKTMNVVILMQQLIFRVDSYRQVPKS